MFRFLLRPLLALALLASLAAVVLPVVAEEGVTLDTLTAQVFLPLVGGQKKYPPDNRAYEVEMIRLVNEARVSAGLAPLAEHTTLTNAARRHAEDMAANNFLSHTGSDGTRAWQRAIQEGYPRASCGEVATMWSTPQSAVAAFMESAPHRAIVLDSGLVAMGVGYAVQDGRHYFVGVLCA